MTKSSGPLSPEEGTQEDKRAAYVRYRNMVLHQTILQYHLMKVIPNELFSYECIPLPESAALEEGKVVPGMSDVEVDANVTVTAGRAKAHHPFPAFQRKVSETTCIISGFSRIHVKVLHPYDHAPCHRLPDQCQGGACRAGPYFAIRSHPLHRDTRNVKQHVIGFQGKASEYR